MMEPKHHSTEEVLQPPSAALLLYHHQEHAHTHTCPDSEHTPRENPSV